MLNVKIPDVWPLAYHFKVDKVIHTLTLSYDFKPLNITFSLSLEKYFLLAIFT